jgi:hypothetical protein
VTLIRSVCGRYAYESINRIGSCPGILDKRKRLVSMGQSFGLTMIFSKHNLSRD